ncbi:unnamed protein product [Caretta caretta]
MIHPDQTYTVPGRSIFDNLFLVRDLLELGRRDGLSFALLSLDQEKAFDRVGHGYLLGTLQAFGFGPQFNLGDLARVEACQAIYSAASSARVNWVKSSGLAVEDWRQYAKPFYYSLSRERLMILRIKEWTIEKPVTDFKASQCLIYRDPEGKNKINYYDCNWIESLYCTLKRIFNIDNDT